MGHGITQTIGEDRYISDEALAFEAEINRIYISKLEKGATWVGLEILEAFNCVEG
ncbi:hypothetical protein HAP41_0000004580 [Bradyrhizobium barranii subsp. apii]|uniref:Uncharacterized protein n=1 Tax=Bradyrhizobium barranii subsp. apii TaxID=2819348 RepID=A0A8T5VRL4_9BRAD|nr:hypothetical protein [Bradyrhizobium barranii]UPT88415.1 hypothetical protein HAP41_0000004580 [Bradyrhizobium barranii subsp. apii]